jgi:hypothetical protein
MTIIKDGGAIDLSEASDRIIDQILLCCCVECEGKLDYFGWAGGFPPYSFYECRSCKNKFYIGSLE